MKQSASPSAPLTVDPAWRIGIVHSSFYKEEMAGLVDSAKKALLDAGIAPQNMQEFPVAGSFEIPLIGSAVAEAKKADALLGLGIIVEGETAHARLLAESVAHGMMEIQIRYRIPFAFEVLHVTSIAQARERMDKGREAAFAVLHSLAELKRIRA